jgi:hypothetical protein
LSIDVINCTRNCGNRASSNSSESIESLTGSKMMPIWGSCISNITQHFTSASPQQTRQSQMVSLHDAEFIAAYASSNYLPISNSQLLKLGKSSAQSISRHHRLRSAHIAKSTTICLQPT